MNARSLTESMFQAPISTLARAARTAPGASVVSETLRWRRREPGRDLSLGPARPRHAAPRVGVGLTVLIPAYNEGKFVGETIRSVLEQTVRPERIIVIDDCSTDDTGEVARSFAHAGVECVRPAKNCGSKASALNFALALVGTPFTLAIDADTTLAPDAIERLMVHFKDRAGADDPKTAIVCGMVIPRRVRTLWERGRYIEYLYAFTFYKPIQDYYRRPLIASGCFSAYRTDVLRTLGGWSMRTVGEDMDLTWSVYKLGLDVRFAEDAVCYPVEPHNFAFLRKQLTRWSHGFVQNVRVHWRDIVHMPMMGKMVGVAVWDALMAVVGLFVLVPLLAIFVHPLFLLAYVIDLPMVMVPVLTTAARRGEVLKAIASIPGFAVIRLVNSLFVLAAFWNEFVAGRELKTFEKGH